MSDMYDHRKKEMARRVVAAEKAGETPRTADGRPIVVLTEDRWFTTSSNNVTCYDVTRARANPADYRDAMARERLRRGY